MSKARRKKDRDDVLRAADVVPPYGAADAKKTRSRKAKTSRKSTSTSKKKAKKPAKSKTAKSAAAERDSTIVNEEGGLQLLFPQGGRCKLEAESVRGDIESELQDVRITDDGRFANALLGGGEKPVIRASAGEDIRIASSRPPGS